jgi:hypothetical protein
MIRKFKKKKKNAPFQIPINQQNTKIEKTLIQQKPKKKILNISNQ